MDGLAYVPQLRAGIIAMTQIMIANQYFNLKAEAEKVCFLW